MDIYINEMWLDPALNFEKLNPCKQNLSLSHQVTYWTNLQHSKEYSRSWRNYGLRTRVSSIRKRPKFTIHLSGK